MTSSLQPALPPDTVTGHDADAIIVLGGGIRRDGELTVASRRRVEHGIALYQAGLAPRLILTGRHGAFLSKPVSEAVAMAALARQAQVPDSDILLEDHSRHTLGNALLTRDRYLLPNRWRRIHVVTCDFHRRRAAALFRAVLGSQFDCTFSVVPAGLTAGELVLRLLEPPKLALDAWRLRAIAQRFAALPAARTAD